MKTLLLVPVICMALARPAFAWAPQWCYEHHVSTGACAQYYPPSQSQNQNQTASASAGASSSSNARGGSSTSTNSNYVDGGGSQENLPVAPLAGCDSGAALSVGGSVGHDNGLFGGTSTTLYAAASFPIGRRHCEVAVPVPPPPAPVTNVYYVPVPTVVEHRTVAYRSRPACSSIPSGDVAWAKARIGVVRGHGRWVHKPLRLRHSTSIDEAALRTLIAACVPLAALIDP